jgi:hypothetical protein
MSHNLNTTTHATLNFHGGEESEDGLDEILGPSRLEQRLIGSIACMWQSIAYELSKNCPGCHEADACWTDRIRVRRKE